MTNPKSEGTCFWHLARRTNWFSRRDARSTLIPSPNLHSRSGDSADRRHSGVRTCGALPSRRYDRGETRGRTLITLCLLLSAFCFGAWGQNYSIDWHTIDGGGGTSTGGVYSVSGTIGQPDAGMMSGGNYTLQGGFWGVIAAVQTPGAPWLTITRSNNVVIVSWPLPADGWVLQATNALPQVAAPWPQIPPPYQTNGANLQFIEPTPTSEPV